MLASTSSSRKLFERGLFPHLLELGEPIYGYPFGGYWLDMGTPEKYLRLNCDLLLSEANSALIGALGRDEVRYEGDVVIDPSAEIVGPVVIGSGCRIGQKVRIRGPVTIGPDCYIGEGATIESAVLWTGVNIGAGASLERCVVSSNARIEDNERVINSTVTPDTTELLG
jgi:mannose-1-phosphate guanylyltransferase